MVQNCSLTTRRAIPIHKLRVQHDNSLLYGTTSACSPDLIEEYLQRFEYARDGYVKLIRVPGYEQAEIIVDPYRSSGAPIFARGGCRVKDVLNRYWAGETVQELTVEFGVPTAHVEDAIRVASPRAA